MRIYYLPTTEQFASLFNNFFGESLLSISNIFLIVLAAICLTAIFRSHIFSTITSQIFLSLDLTYFGYWAINMRMIFMAVMHILKLQSYVQSRIPSTKSSDIFQVCSPWNFLLMSSMISDLTCISLSLPSNPLLSSQPATADQARSGFTWP